MRLLSPFLPAWLLAVTAAVTPTLYIMLDGTGVPCVRKDTEGVKGKGKDGKAILYRFGGASLIKHMHKRYATLDANQEAWKKLGYIDERRDCMKYGEYLKQGLYIGSGLIESACRTDVARRCKQSGMHWRFKNAASMCALVARFRSNLHAA